MKGIVQLEDTAKINTAQPDYTQCKHALKYIRDAIPELSIVCIVASRCNQVSAASDCIVYLVQTRRRASIIVCILMQRA